MEKIIQEKNSTGNNNFNGLGIAPALLDIVARYGFKTPTPIQERAIPIAVQGKDVVGIAQTGTGKTLAFGLPMIQRLAEIKGKGLIVLPTRELALQVDETMRKIGKQLGLRTAVLIGGASMGPQMSALRQDPHVIVATPGRLIDHLEQKNVHLGEVRIVVLDEADRMLDMGFMPQIKRIFDALPHERQTMLFSATMPAEIMQVATRYMQLPVRVEVAPAGTTVERVSQELFIVTKDQKIGLLAKLFETYQGPTLVFTRTKHGAKKVMRQIHSLHISAAEIHSNRSLNQRKEALEGFRRGKYRVLVATDIASRGIDVRGIELVVNFDLPSTSDDYVHRIGRTARAGAAGHAITFAMPDEGREVRAIERLIRAPLPISALPKDLPRVAAPAMREDFREPRGSRGYAPRPHPRRDGFGGGSQRTFRSRSRF